MGLGQGNKVDMERSYGRGLRSCSEEVASFLEVTGEKEKGGPEVSNLDAKMNCDTIYHVTQLLTNCILFMLTLPLTSCGSVSKSAFLQNETFCTMRIMVLS